MLSAEQNEARENGQINWWRSEDAFATRCGRYLAHMLWADARNKRREYLSLEDTGPEWPAVFYYDAETDQHFWVECRIPTHLRDYERGCTHFEHMNAAARLILESN